MLRARWASSAPEEADEADRGAAPRGDGEERHYRRDAERIINSITSFALYGFPESHAASFALLAYASAYLKVHLPAAFLHGALNNQPMGFYHPRRSSRTRSAAACVSIRLDVQQRTGCAAVEDDGAIRIGFMYVNGLRKDVGQAMAAFDRTKTLAPPLLCAKAGATTTR
jgi:DNA polymerase III alpha subunit